MKRTTQPANKTVPAARRKSNRKAAAAAAALLSALVLLSACGRQPMEVAQTSPSPAVSDAAPAASAAPASAFADEAALRAFLANTWSYTPSPNQNQVAAEAISVAMAADGGYTITVTEPDGADQTYTGTWSLSQWAENDPDPLPDWLRFTLSDSWDDRLNAGGTCGDYRLSGHTLCDGEWMLRMVQVNNGDSVFSLWADDVAPVLHRPAEEAPGSAPRTGGPFLAVCWKADGDAGTIYLDDVALKDGRLVNDAAEALPYAWGEAASVYGAGVTYPGLFCRVTVNDEGAVTALEPLGVSLVCSEEEAFMALAEVDVIQSAIDRGQVPEHTGEIVEIQGAYCAVYALGGAWSGRYAVSGDGTVYWEDPPGQWEALEGPDLSASSGDAAQNPAVPVSIDPDDPELMAPGEADPDDPELIQPGEDLEQSGAETTEDNAVG